VFGEPGSEKNGDIQSESYEQRRNGDPAGTWKNLDTEGESNEARGSTVEISVEVQ
jgi:hypothetical protein